MFHFLNLVNLFSLNLNGPRKIQCRIVSHSNVTWSCSDWGMSHYPSVPPSSDPPPHVPREILHFIQKLIECFWFWKESFFRTSVIVNVIVTPKPSYLMRKSWFQMPKISTDNSLLDRFKDINPKEINWYIWILEHHLIPSP